MNFWHETVFVQERCADIRHEVDRYRQIRQAQLGQSWFGQRMLSLGLWLVSVGGSLCRRYETAETRTALVGSLQG